MSSLRPLRTHGRYEYSPITRRPDYSWPGGRRLAVYIGFNVEHFEFGQGLGAKLAPSGEPDVLNFAWRDYGNRVGAWRLLEFADACDLPYALLINSELYDYCPELVGAYSERGHEIVGHGRTNAERQTEMKADEEHRAILEATGAIEKHWGRKPLGWLAPYIAQNHDSLDLLKEAGYRYMMDWSIDDQPVWFRTKHGPILSVPYAHDLNDSVECVSRRTPSQVLCENLTDQFDEMLAESERRPLVMSIVLHSFVLGQPHRLRQFRRVIEHILRHRDRIWLTRPGEICQFVEKLPAGVVPGSKQQG